MEIRPRSGATSRRTATGLGFAAAGIAVIGAGVAAATGDTLAEVGRSLIMVGLIAIPVALVAVYVGLYLRTARVVLTAETVTKTRFGWFPAQLRRDRVYGLCAPLVQPGEFRIFPIAYLREHDGSGRGRGRRIKLSGWYWSDEAIVDVCAALSIPVLETVTTGREFERAAPGALSFRYRRPIVWAFSVVLGGIGVVAILALSWSLVHAP